MKTYVYFIILCVSILWSANCHADNTIVIKTICYEAQNQSLEGQIAVARVIRNRMKQRNLTAEEVCLQPWQFSCWNKGVKNPYISPVAYIKAKQAWELSKKSTLKANLYYNPKLANPYWAHSDKVKYITTIGEHIFMVE